MFEPIRETDSEQIINKKIIFTGLDNSGKSSIIIALQHSLAKLATLAPTKGVERASFDYLGFKIAAHDLGGQKKYLINYLKQPGKYFADTNAIIYVIDVQDVARYEESTSYFGDVLNELQDLEITPVIFVLFHKSEHITLEGDAESKTELEGSGMVWVEKLKQRITDIITGRMDVEFRLTTIFDPWSISSAFSDLMLKLVPQSVLLDQALQDYGQSSNLDALLLLDVNSLYLASYHKNNDAKEILRSSTPYFLTLLDSWKPFKKDASRKQMKVTMNLYSFLFLELVKEKKPSGFYFLAMSATGQVDPKKLDEFSRIILSMLST
jgi:hypothetical protein